MHRLLRGSKVSVRVFVLDLDWGLSPSHPPLEALKATAMAPSCALESALPSLPGPLQPPLKIPRGNGTLASARRRVRIPSSHSGRDEYWRTPMCEAPPVLRVARSHCSDDQSSATSFTNTGLDTCESVAPPGAMARVLAVDPNAGRCLLTDTDSDIQLVYCIPRDLHPSKVGL